jgi:predicted ester cyclase
MKRSSAAGTLLMAAACSFSAAQAEMTTETAASVVAPFYKALNAEFAAQSPNLIRDATAPGWVSCRSNDLCVGRDAVISAISARLQSVPDLKWDIMDVVVSGNQVVVRGEATGTPYGDFLGAPHSGKAFKIMSIDVHTVEGGKIVRSYHVEDWLGAVNQLTAR